MEYKCTPEDVFRFADHVHQRIKVKGDEATFNLCPYCEGGLTHKDKNTFSINIRTGQFFCQRGSCGASGNMINLSEDFDFFLNEEIARFHNIGGYNNRFRKFKQQKQEEAKEDDKAILYLQKRGISKKTATAYGVTTKKDNDNLIVFPFTDDKGELKFIKYRKIKMQEGEKGKEFCEPGCMPILYGMNKTNPENRRLIITEGQIDMLSLAECGVENVASVPLGKNGFTWIPHCWQWINDNFDEIVIFGDYENGEISLLDPIAKRFYNKNVLSVKKENYKDCKDANDILIKYGREQILKCLEDLDRAPVKQTIALSEVEDVDVYQIPKVPTGIFELDKMLCGGLPLGGITLVTGKAGEGKSTLASQILVNAIGEGYKIFAYSGELPNALFKSWFCMQIAGPANVFSYQNDQYGNTRYKIRKEAMQKVTEFYKDKIFIYDNRIAAGLEDELSTLTEIIEKNIISHNTKVILIDNIMTALDLERLNGFDKYDVQSNFMKRLTKLALQHNVLILLIAHKRKNNVSVNENDEIAGSSDIANLGMLTLSFQKWHKTDHPTGDRELRVSKNRLFGTVTDDDGIGMSYNEGSRRVYSTEKELQRDYIGTDPEQKDKFIKIDQEEDCPF